jgi:DNA-directed RNA polymerase subunit RPC12/RpoP/DNA-binding beta-propeller fold protein YncE
MLQSFECPNCQANLDFDAQTQAITVRCPYCNSTVIVPDTLRNQRGQTVQQPEILAQVVQLVQNGRKIEAIKLFRETFSVGLKESKDVVDAIERREDIHLGGTNFHTGTVSISTFTGTPTVQTSSGRGGCVAFLVLLVIGIIGVGLFFLVFPSDRTTSGSQIIQEVSNAIESSSETVSEIAEEVAPTKPQFAEIILQFGGEEGVGPGFFNDTRRLAIDGEGNIYAGDYSGGRIQVFDANGKFLATWNAGEDLYMGGMTADHSGTVYILNIDKVEKYNGMTGEFLGTLNLPGGQRTYYETTATGPDGSVYLVAEDRLIRLDNSGNIVLDLKDPFANIPDFATTHNDVAIDGAGNIYVMGSETIYKLNAQGQFVDQIGSKGDAEDQFFTSPTALAVDGKGRIFVNDFYGIKVFEGNGRYLTIIDSPGVAFDMLVTNENDLLVMDRNGNEIRKYRLNQ